MGVQERRTLEIAEMKKRIIGAAMQLIAQEGYEKLSIRKIAAKIQYSPTTLYLYYKDKAEIITDMADALYSKVAHNAAAAIQSNATLPIDIQLHSVLSVFIQSLCSEPEMARAIMYSGTNVIFAKENTGDKPTNEGLAMLDHLLADGIAQKLLRPNIANASWMLVSALLGFVLNAIENELYKQEDFDRVVDAFVELLMGGMRR